MDTMRAWSNAGFRHPVAFLVITLWAALLLGGYGCGGSLYSSGGESRLAAVIRPASGDSERLLRNAHYFGVMGKPHLALKELEEAYQKDPQNLKVVDALARIYQDLGDFQHAQKLYQQALAKDASHPGLHNNLCFSYYLAGQWEAAEACFRQALTRNPQNTAARNNLGLVLVRTGKVDEARRLWREAEGQAVAQSRVNEALAFLGMKGPVTYAQSSQPAPAVSSARPPEKQSPAPTRAAQPAPPAPISPKPEVRPQPADLVKSTITPKKEAPVAAAATAAKPEVRLQPAKPTQAPNPSKDEASLAYAPVAAEVWPIPVVPAQQPSAPAAQGEAIKPTPGGLLTAEERVETTITVLNGNGVRRFARKTRTLLREDGFHVTRIGNYRDFGKKQTVIYYRPGTEKVVQALMANFYPNSQAQKTTKLPKKANIQIVLGRDLLHRPQLMAQLAAVR